MLSVEGQVLVRCSVDEAWALFCEFGEVAKLIPTVQQAEVDGDRVHATVATTLGALPITSRVALEVTERRERELLRARGVSYLGETIHDQIDQIRNITKDSAGQFDMELHIEPAEQPGQVLLRYRAEVEASGKLKRIYKAILKNKVPAMMDEFAANLRGALESGAGAARHAEQDGAAGEGSARRVTPPAARAVGARAPAPPGPGMVEQVAVTWSGYLERGVERVPLFGKTLAELWRGAFEMLVLMARRRRIR